MVNEYQTDESIQVESAFKDAVVPGSPAMSALKQMQSGRQLFGGSPRAVSPGAIMALLIQHSGYAGSAGVHPAAQFSKIFTEPEFQVFSAHNRIEGIYFWLHGNHDSLRRALQRGWHVDTLKVPRAGVLERDKYPILFFTRKNGKLYLAAITREFYGMVGYLWQLQLQ